MGHTGTVEPDRTRVAVLPSKCNTGGRVGEGVEVLARKTVSW